jgi:AraC family transcriptional regulator of adaptative response/methylated-DNA-[protein]-cysteine methyltransferase
VKTTDYDRIAKAIHFLVDHVQEQPSLERVAAHVHMSPFHFQRLFCRWAGISPKRFLQVLTLEHSKQLLSTSLSLLETSHASGLSSGSRLYDHFVKMEAVTPGEFKSKGQQLSIEYGVQDSPFGQVFLAQTARGICQIGFIDSTADQQRELQVLKQAWPMAAIKENSAAIKPTVLSVFTLENNLKQPLSLHVAGTNFQVKVWQALLKVASGSVVSYSQLAANINAPKSARAVGSAVAKNPIGYIIPCHRVIQHSGAHGNYRWGPARKQVIQVWEKLSAHNS